MSDITKQSLTELVEKIKNIKEQIIKNSPEDNEDYFVVPKVIE